MQIKGITVLLLDRTQTGTDDFNRPVYEETEVPVSNVLVAPVSDKEIIETLELTGRKAVYQLAIPKGDTNRWEGQRVSFFGETWRVIGKPVKGIEELMPLPWNMKVKVESVDEQCGSDAEPPGSA